MWVFTPTFFFWYIHPGLPAYQSSRCHVHLKNAIDLIHDAHYLCTYFTINGIKKMSRGISLSGGTQVILSFVANFSSFSLAESPPRDLQITFCSCAVSSNCVLCFAITLAWKMADRFASRGYSLKNKLGDRMIKQLLNSDIQKYRDLSVSRRSINK